MTDDLAKQLRAARESGDPWAAWHLALQAADRIEELEAALRSYVCNCTTEICDDRETSTECGYRARKTLDAE